MNQDDYSSLVAATLNSNMYIKGLSLLDYLDLNNKVVPFNKAANRDPSQITPFSTLLDNVALDRTSEILTSFEVEEKLLF